MMTTTMMIKEISIINVNLLTNIRLYSIKVKKKSNQNFKVIFAVFLGNKIQSVNFIPSLANI